MRVSELSDAMLEAAVRAYGGPGTMRGGMAAEILRLRREVVNLRYELEELRKEKGGSK